MANETNKLEWCIARLGEDMNWWVEEISDAIHWDIDGLSILDPRQMNHIIELIEPLHEYEFANDILEAAFYSFRIDSKVDEHRVRLNRFQSKLLSSEDLLFALPDLIDDEQGPYVDFLNHITKLRVKLLNEAFNFEQKLTVEELEDTLSEEQNIDFMEGRAIHVFNEVCKILEYVPAGFELDDEGFGKEASNVDVDQELDDEFPDIEEDEKIEEDETMKWDDEDEKKDEEDFFDEDEESEGDEEDDDEGFDEEEA